MSGKLEGKKKRKKMLIMKIELYMYTLTCQLFVRSFERSESLGFGLVRRQSLIWTIWAM
jgi:hypothetical protein